MTLILLTILAIYAFKGGHYNASAILFVGAFIGNDIKSLRKAIKKAK